MSLKTIKTIYDDNITSIRKIAQLILVTVGDFKQYDDPVDQMMKVLNKVPKLTNKKKRLNRYFLIFDITNAPNPPLAFIPPFVSWVLNNRGHFSETLNRTYIDGLSAQKQRLFAPALKLASRPVLYECPAEIRAYFAPKETSCGALSDWSGVVSALPPAT